jgi:phage tail P2-like protein
MEVLAMAKLTDIKLIDLIPPSLRNDEQVKAAAEALDQELKSVTEAIRETILFARINELPEQVIDLLAWQFHVDFYDPLNMTISEKRALVLSSIDWHRRIGTPAVVQEMVSTLFTGGTVYEWWEYGGEPYHFRVEVTDTVQDGSLYDNLVSLINAVKNTRSRLDGVIMIKGSSLEPYLGIAQFHSSHMVIDVEVI